METLILVVGWLVALFIGGLELILLFMVLTKRIDLTFLISEALPSRDASLSRFQFLIFTFVIALSLFLIVISSTPPAFPEIPSGVVALLGISGGSYVIAKGITVSGQSAKDGTDAASQQPQQQPPANPPATPSGTTLG